MCAPHRFAFPLLRFSANPTCRGLFPFFERGPIMAIPKLLFTMLHFHTKKPGAPGSPFLEILLPPQLLANIIGRTPFLIGGVFRYQEPTRCETQILFPPPTSTPPRPFPFEIEIPSPQEVRPGLESVLLKAGLLQAVSPKNYPPLFALNPLQRWCARGLLNCCRLPVFFSLRFRP